MLDYLFRLAIAIDQLLNVAICDGEPDETMSSNAYRMHRNGGRWGFLKWVIDLVASPFERDHCYKAFQSELLRLHLPPDARVEPHRLHISGVSHK